MLKVRIIPTLLWKQFGLVKGIRFDSWRRIGPVLPSIKVYNRRDVDELLLVDIVAHRSNGELDYESIAEFSKDCFVPLTIGGGVRSQEHVQRLLRSGADKISINTASYSNPTLISEVAKRYGSQSIVASIDVRASDKKWRAYSHAGTVDTGKDAVEWAREIEGRGAGEILVTSIDNDGTMQGYDLRLVEEIVAAVSIPVIASGGAGRYEHLIEVVKKAGASAVAAASMFHFTEQTPAGAKLAMEASGILVRRRYSETSDLP
jgi:cyclase